MAAGTWSPWRTLSPVLETHPQSHETLISRNASSTASAQLVMYAQGYRRKLARDAAPAACSGRKRAASGRYSEAVTELAGGDSRFASDRGAADPAVTAALAAFAAGQCGEHEALTVLAATRLLVPVVAVLAGEAASGPAPAGPAAGQAEKDSEMAIPAIVGRDGRQALPAFTGIETMQRWRPAARPVPVPAASVWQSAVDQAQAVVIDIAGPVPLVIEGSRLLALASGAPVPQLQEDPDVRAAVAAAAASQLAGILVRLGPPPANADLTLELAPADPDAFEPVPAGLAEAIAGDVAARLGSRARRGIAVRVRPPAAGRTH
jgi:hypothetical protein